MKTTSKIKMTLKIKMTSKIKMTLKIKPTKKKANSNLIRTSKKSYLNNKKDLKN